LEETPISVFTNELNFFWQSLDTTHQCLQHCRVITLWTYPCFLRECTSFVLQNSHRTRGLPSSTQGGLCVKGSGEILITLACKDYIGTGTLCKLLRPIDCTTEGIKSALHWLCLAHMSEMLRLKDTTLDFFLQMATLLEPMIHFLGSREHLPDWTVTRKRAGTQSLKSWWRGASPNLCILCTGQSLHVLSQWE
jgi:hypothetical protein